MYVNVRSVGVGRVGVCILCVCDNEQNECWVGTGVSATMLSETLQVVGLTEVVTRTVWLRKKTMNLCSYDRE